MLKIMTILGTRPELIKMSRVIAELDKQFKHILVHSGQNYDYELNEIFFEELDIRKPDYFLNISNSSFSQALADIMINTNTLLDEIKPDAVLFYGDTNTCLAVIIAKRKKIPIFHMEAGNRCFDQRVPEEINRKIVDHLSDINLVLTEHARRYLISEGLHPEKIIKTGSHMHEVLNYYMPKILESKILEKLNLSTKKYFVVSMHREENVDCPVKLNTLLEILNEISLNYNYPIIISTHPRTQKKLDALNLKNNSNKLLIFVKPFGFIDYIKLQLNSYCILSDSGTITEECSLLNLPAVTIRDAQERPEGMDNGILVMSPLIADRVMQSIELIVSQNLDKKEYSNFVPDYIIGAVSKQIPRIILSYIDLINQKTWYKSNKSGSIDV
jgi:UDP-N-acetylglucosamine 2-epimerase (non-hydrolysing)